MEQQNEEQTGFLRKLFGFGMAPERRRALRLLKRELNSARIDLYKLKQDLVQAPVARIIYDLYRYTHPLKQLLPLDGKKKQNLAPSFIDSFVRAFHNERAGELYDQLSEDKIGEAIRTHGLKRASLQVEKQLEEYLDCFDQKTIQEINQAYSSFLGFARMAWFDFYPVLREFDPHLEESEFTRKPQFAPAEGTLLRDDLYNLNRALHGFTTEWLDKGLEVFVKMRGLESLNTNILSKLKKLIADVQKNDYFSLLVRAIDKSANPLVVPRPLHVDVFNTFSIKMKGQVHAQVNAIRSRMRNNAVEALASKIFGQTIEKRVRNYSQSRSEQLKNFGLSGFACVEPLNYVQAFCADKYKHSIAETVNELIIGGVFVHKGMLNTLSNSYYELNKTAHRIGELEAELDAEGESGEIIARHLSILSKNPNSRSILEKTIRAVNQRAELIVTQCVVDLKDMALCIKSILEDTKNPRPSYVSNLKKIRSGGNREFISELVSSYQLMYSFLRLLSKYVSIKTTRDELEKKKQFPAVC
jgi:hypothetical protein